MTDVLFISETSFNVLFTGGWCNICIGNWVHVTSSRCFVYNWLYGCCICSAVTLTQSCPTWTLSRWFVNSFRWDSLWSLCCRDQLIHRNYLLFTKVHPFLIIIHLFHLIIIHLFLQLFSCEDQLGLILIKRERRDRQTWFWCGKVSRSLTQAYPSRAASGAGSDTH